MSGILGKMVHNRVVPGCGQERLLLGRDMEQDRNIIWGRFGKGRSELRFVQHPPATLVQKQKRQILLPALPGPAPWLVCMQE